MTRFQSVVKRIVLPLASIVCGVLSAGDGVWVGGSSVSWQDAANWKDRAIAEGEDAAAYLRASASFTFEKDIVLNSLHKLDGVSDSSFERSPAGADIAFYLKNNPLVYSVPPCSVGVEIYFKGNNIIKGDGSVLTFEGSSYNFDSGTAGKYAISGYDLVVAKDVISFSPRSRGGLVDGDLKLVNSRLNANLKADATTVTNAPISGKLIIGSGLNYFRMGYLSTMMLPTVIAREPRGVFCTYASENLHGLRMTNAADYVNGEGRFPTWFLYGTANEFKFLAYDETEGTAGGFKPATIPGAHALSADTTDKQTVLVDNAAGTTSMGGDVKAAAVKVQTLLDLDDGATLTLGNEQEPGLLMLNSHATGLDGTVKFAGPDGIIVANGGEKRLETRLSGSSSVAVVAGYDSAYRTLHLDNPQNDFSGGLDVLIGVVAVTNGGALGTGPVRVHGFPGNFDWDFTNHDGKNGLTGGAGVLQLKGATVTNDLMLAGIGPIAQGDNFGRPLCALRLGDGSRVEGSVTLDNGASIRGDAGFAEIAGPVRGAHKLYLWPYTDGVLRLSNTFDMGGRSIEITSPKNGTNYMGTVQLASTASFGASDVRNDATLVFESERVFDNVLTGWGTYLQTNDFSTVFTKRFEQGGVYAGKGTIRFEAATNAVGSLVGEGAIELAAKNAQLTVGSDDAGYDGYFKGSLTTPEDGTLTLVKKGANTQILASPLSFTGDVVVEGGTLRLGGIGNALPQTTTPAQFHMDGADASTVVTNENGKVSAWVNKGTATGDNFLQDDEGRMPTYSADAMGGKGGLVFNGTRAIATDGNGSPTYGGSLQEGEEVRTNRLCLARATANVRSLYMAYRVKDAHSFAGPIGEKDKDSGIRWSDDGGSPSFNFDLGFAKGKWGIESNMFWLNGKNIGSAKLNETLVMSAVLSSKDAKCLSIGQYIATFPSQRKDYNYPRALDGDVGELLVYSNPLKPQEDYMVSKYLFNKWGVAEDAAAENVLPVTATLTVREGATVDFAGVNQTLERIDNAGILMNSSADEVVLTVKSGTLGGTIKGNIRIVKQGEGTLALDNAFIDSWTGGISVRAGALVFKTWRNMELPVKDGLSFHLDAADVSSLEFADGDNRVTTWKDVSGNAFDFNEDPAIVSGSPLGMPPPKFDGSLYDDRGGLVFEANGIDYDGANRLSSGENKCVVRTIFFMTQTDGCVKKEDGGGSFSGLFGERDNDWGIRLSSDTSYAPYRTVKEGNTTEKGFGVGDYYFVNGEKKTGFTKGERYVFQTSTNGDGWNTAWALGQYTTFNAGAGGRRGYIGSIGEVVAYNRLIAGDEQKAITAYLREKWIDGVRSSMELNENISIEVAEGATLDLGKTTQTLNGLSGSGGTIQNGNLTVGGTLEVWADANGDVAPYVFDGVEFEDGLRIVFKGVPAPARFVVAKGVKRANASTFVLPSAAWTATFRKDELVLSRGATLLILR